MDDGLKKVAEVIDSATEAPPPDGGDRCGPPPSGPSGDSWGEGPSRLPKNSPVKAVGRRGTISYVLDQKGQLIEVNPNQLGQAMIESLFGDRIDYLQETWSSERGKSGGYVHAAVRQALLASCAEKPIWNPAGRVRGVGGWRDDDGALVMHYGNAVEIAPADGKPRYIEAPGLQGGYVYPADEAIGWATESSGGGELEAVIDGFTWVRPTDATLMLGFIGAAILGGALDWRPTVWVTGPAASGKSTLHQLLTALFGPGGMLTTTNTSPAGIWQHLGARSVPVLVDESEPDGSGGRTDGLVKLARLASSGGIMLRGGAAHDPREFQMRSSFMLFSTLVASLEPQDLRRIAVLTLGPRGDAKTFSIDAPYWSSIGSGLRAQMFQQWHRADETLRFYRDQFAERGHANDTALQYGTLLGCYDLLMYNETPDVSALADDERVQAVFSAVGPDTLEVDGGREKRWRQCLNHLMAAPVPYWRAGQAVTIGWLVGIIANPALVADDPGAESAAQRALRQYGIAVLPPELDTDRRPISGMMVAVANNHAALQRIYQGTPWESRATGTGIWRQALKEIPGSVVGRAKMRFAGVQTRALLFPIEAVESEGDEWD